MVIRGSPSVEIHLLPILQMSPLQPHDGLVQDMWCGVYDFDGLCSSSEIVFRSIDVAGASNHIGHPGKAYLFRVLVPLPGQLAAAPSTGFLGNSSIVNGDESMRSRRSLSIVLVIGKEEGVRWGQRARLLERYRERGREKGR